jgi:NAD(P)-dependent dehydrogenase (short-subunit alcohol dehydrogenase family)
MPARSVTDNGVMTTVLVTGGTGLLGAHTIARLLTDGHQVRTTLRSLSRQADVEAMLAIAQAPGAGSVRYFRADLLSDEGWAEAAAGADHVLHVASPGTGWRARRRLAGPCGSRRPFAGTDGRCRARGAGVLSHGRRTAGCGRSC